MAFAWTGAVLMRRSALRAATFGTVVAIGGEAADLALDEARGVLYVANFTANRIDVMSLSNNVVQTSINVAAQPELDLALAGRTLAAGGALRQQHLGFADQRV